MSNTFKTINYTVSIVKQEESSEVMILLIPIARFLCKRSPKGKHRTFSLLPDNLIPYNRFSIDFLIYILSFLIFNISNFVNKKLALKANFYYLPCCIYLLFI